MIGYISSLNRQKRYGFIKQKGKNFTYYFGFNSVIDQDLSVEIGRLVTFELYKKNDREQVAVSICSLDGSSIATSKTASNTSSKNKTVKNDDDFIDATVLWFSTVKNYGYVACKNADDAFIHSNILRKAGVESVKPRQKLKVKLVENKYPGKKAVSDVIILNNSKHNPGMAYPRPPRYPPSNLVFSSNDLTAIPSSTSDDSIRIPNGSHSTTTSLHSPQIARMPFNRPPSGSHFHPQMSGCPLRPGPYNEPLRTPTSPMSSGLMPGYQHSLLNTLPDAQNQGDFRGLPRTPSNNGRSLRMSRPSTPDHHLSGLSMHSNLMRNVRPNASPRNVFQHERVPVTNPEYAKLKQQISQKENLLKTLNLGKLPDAGQRLRNQIRELKLKISNLSMHEESIETEIVTSKSPKENGKKVAAKPPYLFYDASIYSKYHHQKQSKATRGGRTVFPNEKKQVTDDAIEKLHKSLHTCPHSTKELPDPDGLQVTLMTHQRQALAWMVWREQQSVSGGILADDMGLGKTLTMISLVLRQLANSTAEKKIDESDTTPSETPADSDEITGNDTDSSEAVSSEEDEEKKSINKNLVNAEKCSGIACDSTLIVAPASLIYHWENEIRNRCKKGLFSIHLFHGSEREKNAEKLSEFDVVITTYDLVRRTKSDQSEKTAKESPRGVEDALFHINWRRIILDEAHQIRNHKSQTSEAVCSLQAQSRWALSGTPIQNDENDMYAMLKFLHCKPFDELKLWKGQVCNRSAVGRKRLKTLVSCFVLRREKSQKGADGKPLVALPKRTFTTHKTKLNEIEKEVYTKLKQESCTAFQKYQIMKKNKDIPADKQPYSRSHSSPNEKLSATSLLVQLLRLRQCCNHLHLLKGSFDVDLLEKERQQVAVEDLLESLTLKEEDKNESFKTENYVEKDKAYHFEMTASSSKVKYVMDLLIKLDFEKPNEKSVIVSQWTSMLRIMACHLELAKLSFAVIEGGVTARKRMTLVDEFNRNPIKPKIMLVSLQAGGVGLNLIGANHLFLLDMHWNPALEKQAFDRIYRVGQTKNVFVHKLISEGTVDEQILKLQQEKIFVANSIMAGADADSKVKLTLSDMKMLFGI